MSWVEELASKNGNRATPSALPLPPPSSVLPSGPVAALSAPPRVCFAEIQEVSNPAISFRTANPLCGQPQRKDLDAVTFDKAQVTCPQCQARLSLQEKMTPARPDLPGASPALPVSPFPEGTLSPPGKSGPSLEGFSYQEFLEAVLDVEALQKKQKELEGELAAVGVLLHAALAKQGARVETTGAAD